MRHGIMTPEEEKLLALYRAASPKIQAAVMDALTSGKTPSVKYAGPVGAVIVGDLSAASLNVVVSSTSKKTQRSPDCWTP